MTAILGNNGAVYIGANAVAEISQFSVNETVETQEANAMGQTSKRRLSGFSDWTAETTCFWDPADTNGQGSLTVGASVTLALYPDGNTTGKTYYTGTALVKTIDRNAAVNETVNMSVSFEGSGDLTESTVA